MVVKHYALVADDDEGVEGDGDDDDDVKDEDDDKYDTEY